MQFFSDNIDCCMNINIKIQYHFLPANLQQQLAALRRLEGHTSAPAPAPAFAPVSVKFFLTKILIWLII